MKIARITVTHHRHVFDGPPFAAAWDPRPRKALAATLVRVTGDDGTEGVGSGDRAAGLDDYVDLFLGREADDLERHGQVVENMSFHGARYWPLENALWDLVARGRGQPGFELCGGASSGVRAYASLGTLYPAEEMGRRAGAVAAAGFPALKFRLGRPELDQDLAALAAVREAVGPDVAVMVDCNQAWRMPWDTARPWGLARAVEVAKELAAFDVYWMEEPLHRLDFEGMRALRAEGILPIAAGEMTRERGELERLVEDECVDFLQPDAALTGGIGWLAGLARRAAGKGVTFTPHTWGNGVQLLANAHLTAGVGTAPFLELPLDPPDWTAERRDFMLAAPVEADDAGYLELGEAPGFSGPLDEARLAATQVGEAEVYE